MRLGTTRPVIARARRYARAPLAVQLGEEKQVDGQHGLRPGGQERGGQKSREKGRLSIAAPLELGDRRDPEKPSRSRNVSKHSTPPCWSRSDIPMTAPENGPGLRASGYVSSAVATKKRRTTKSPCIGPARSDYSSVPPGRTPRASGPPRCHPWGAAPGTLRRDPIEAEEDLQENLCGGREVVASAHSSDSGCGPRGTGWRRVRSGRASPRGSRRGWRRS